jgi:LmbE family N-acetylglucosaminyl deacetylase
MAAVSRIAFETDRGSLVYCVFLTDGTAGNVAADIRNRESIAVLTHLGVDASRILFIGSEIPIRDGTLVDHLDLALEQIESRMKGIEVSSIYCLAWEGGHQDHDASHLIAAAFAQRRGMIDRCFEMPLYHGAGTVGPLFRVFSPTGKRKEWDGRRLKFGEGLRLSLLAWRYRSQRSSWLGLFPEAFLKLAILRRELVRRVDPSRFRERPHSGPLLYERRFRFPHERFARAAAAFIDDHFPRVAKGRPSVSLR